jgi:hypothetical protein
LPEMNTIHLTPLMIHEIEEKHLNLDLEEYLITLDDGLYNQYYYYPFLKQMSRQMIFFICTHFIRTGGMRKTYSGEALHVQKHATYIVDAFAKNRFDQFMTIDEVCFLADQEDVIIGSHSHYHDIILTRHPLKKKLTRWKLDHLPGPDTVAGKAPLNRRSKLAFQGYIYEGSKLRPRSEQEWIDYIKCDTENTLTFFDTHLNMQPTRYCFPFNEYNDMLVQILKSYGFTAFYNGKTGDNLEIMNRIDIDKLVDND